MALKKQMIFSIGPDGKVHLKTEGFKGDECEDAVKPFQRSLGRVTERQRTSEFYEKSQVSRRTYTSGE